MTCHTDALPGALIQTDVAMDRAELERELEHLHPASFAWALGCCGRKRDEAEEVLQTVYVMVLEGRARFDGRSALKTWLFGVIRNVAHAHARGQWLRELRLMKWFRTRIEPDACEEPDGLAAMRLVTALGELPRRQREVVELVFYHDMTVDDAAAVMNIGAGSARVHYDRAKKRLRALLSS